MVWTTLFFFALLARCRAFAPVLTTSRHEQAPGRNLSSDKEKLLHPSRLSKTSRATSSSFSLHAKLWDRLEIEEDPEPFWYLLNCVAGLEIDLLRQCREVCRDMPDAIKFVVPTEKKTRSHGARKMVTETKVKYQGYVFAKLRLCPEVYEAIQGLDLCRSWMGTVNHKGHKKLPPAPIALNELEVENFGLEQCEAQEDEEQQMTGNIIVDVEDQDTDEKLDKQAIKAYLGLKVEDMVKVTAKGKFYNEDGIIRRLKDGKLLVRFYTYGTMFEEWLQPSDVRKLSNIEILKGLSGPTQPVTQRDFDGPSQGYDDRRPGATRRNLMSDFGGGSGPRNRRQDRNERHFRQEGGFRNDQERGRNDRNWNWYQDQQRDSRRRPNDYNDRSYGYQVGSGNNRSRDRGGDWAIGNADSQWGRNSPQNKRERQPRQDNRRQNQMADAAIRGDDDWSAFVTPAGQSPNQDTGKSNGDDDFFASLMNDLSNDLVDNGENSGFKKPKQSPPDTSTDDDFFSSLLSEISDDDGTPHKSHNKPQPKEQHQSKSDNEDDFFAALEAELGSSFSEANDSESSIRLDASDDLFAKLEAELTPRTKTASPPKAQAKDNDENDFFAELQAELSPLGSDHQPGMDSDATADFFGKLEADLALETKPKAPPPAKPSTKASAKTASTTSSSLSSDHLQKQTVPVLKDMLRERNLKVSGKKAELIERLLQES